MEELEGGGEEGKSLRLSYIMKNKEFKECKKKILSGDLVYQRSRHIEERFSQGWHGEHQEMMNPRTRRACGVHSRIRDQHMHHFLFL